MATKGQPNLGTQVRSIENRLWARREVFQAGDVISAVRLPLTVDTGAHNAQSFLVDDAGTRIALGSVESLAVGAQVSRTLPVAYVVPADGAIWGGASSENASGACFGFYEASGGSVQSAFDADASNGHPPPGAWAGFAGDAVDDDISLEIIYTPATIAAAANDIATASATLSTEVRMAAAAGGSTSASAALSTAIDLAGAAIANAGASGVFASGELLAANAVGVALATAALSTEIRLGGQAVDVATANGALTGWATIQLSGTLYTGQGGVLDPNFWMDAVPGVGSTLYYDATHLTIYPNGEISSDSNNCAAVVQFFDGTNWALGLIVSTPQLAAVASNSASGAGQLTTAVQLAAAATALATATSAFSTGAGLTAAAADTAAASGALSTGVPMSALAQDVVTAVGALTTQIRLHAFSVAGSTADANLNGVIALAAAGACVASAVGGLTTGIRLGGSGFSRGDAQGSITTGIRVAGAALDVVAATGALSTSISLGGAASSQTMATGDLITARLLVGAAIDAVTAVAVLATGIHLDANAAAITQASATLKTTIELIGQASADATVTAVLTDIIDSPPVDAYAIDPAFLVSKTLGVIGTRKTPRFRAKDPEELAVLTFDFSDQLALGQKLTGRIGLQIACIAGTDAESTSVFRGVPSYDTSGTRILQPVRGGLVGCTYQVKVSAATTDPNKKLALAALLPVQD